MGGGQLNLEPLSVSVDDSARAARYAEVGQRLALLLEGETDWVATQATVVCELHAAFEYYHWTGFYRAVGHHTLVIGPYQGGHGCLRIAFDRGVCGAAARTRATQLVPDVHAFPGHIACASSTQSEVVVPVVTPDGRLLAVLDIDSNHPSAFREVDAHELEALLSTLAARGWASGVDQSND